MAPSKIPHVLMQFSLIFCLFTSFTLTHSIDANDCLPNEKKVLFQIKNYFGNPSSLASWAHNTDCITWDGINIDQQGHVIKVVLQDSTEIHGPIPPFLDQLPFLLSLFFDNLPNLSGPIPPSIAKLNRLDTLEITSTNVSGPIPVFLGRLTQLTSLRLSLSQFSGPIPSSLAQLSQLNFLDLNSNHLSGPIPDILGRKLNKLSDINLQYNRLSGRIPPSFSGLNILNLNLSQNRLSGSIPNPLGNFACMSIDISNNYLSGDASFLFDTKYNSLSKLYINNNHFKFDFSNVNLTRSLVAFNISHNMIYGSLPKRFGQMSALPNSVDVSYNQLCGPIPNGRRFKRANPEFFAHNKCLCGGPLPACK